MIPMLLPLLQMKLRYSKISRILWCFPGKRHTLCVLLAAHLRLTGLGWVQDMIMVDYMFLQQEPSVEYWLKFLLMMVYVRGFQILSYRQGTRTECYLHD